tara:strand:- start:1889 stop:2152 length:264 start_codon:yes stop_codon:yes gene_type:complete
LIQDKEEKMDNEKELIANLEKEIQDKQEELNSIKYKEVYEAQDAYDAAQVIYKDAEQALLQASKDLTEAKARNGYTRSYVYRRFYRT